MTAPSIERLREKKELVQKKRSALIENIRVIEDELLQTFSDLEIFGSGCDVTLENLGLDDRIYGHLTFSEDGIAVAYRDTEEDQSDHFNSVPSEYQGYRFRHFSLCKSSWLERLSSEKSVSSLLANLDKQLDEFNSTADKSIDLLKSVLEHQAAEIGGDVANALSAVESESLSKAWSKARRLVSLEPAESITRSNSYLESICKYILHDMAVPLPRTCTMAELIKVCLHHLPLSSDAEAGQLLNQLIGSIKGLCGAIAALRNSHGSAHGVSPGDFEVGEHEARLANNAAATISIFLIHRHAVWRSSAAKAK